MKDNKLQPPATLTELNLRIDAEDKAKLMAWLMDDEKIIGKEIEISISNFRAGELGKFVCKIKGWRPPKIELP